MAAFKEKFGINNSPIGTVERFVLTPAPPSSDSSLSLEWADSLTNKNRRRSTIHSYTIAVYRPLPQNAPAMKEIQAMTSSKTAKNLISISFAFMLIHTGFVSLQSLQSSLHPHGGVGLVSLSVIYGTTVLSCLLAPWLISRLTTKWTVVLAFSFYTIYIAANFYPRHFLVLPMSILLGIMAGPMWSAQATYVTTLALIYSQHRKMVFEADDVINQFMGVFFGFHRCSQILGNLISTLIFARNETELIANSSLYHRTYNMRGKNVTDITEMLPIIINPMDKSHTNHCISTNSLSNEEEILCGTKTCSYDNDKTATSDDTYTSDFGDLAETIPTSTLYMLLTSYMTCGVMAVVIVVSLVDHIQLGSSKDDAGYSPSSWQLCSATVGMLKDTKCLLLMPFVVFVGLEQGFVFGDFTKTYVNCAMGVRKIGPILISFGTVSAVSSITIGCFSRHIKRFAFMAAGAIFNIGLLIVLWLWNPQEEDVPNFYVVSACLGLCDAIWQTQTYTLFAILFSHKQEAAFASYRMFHAGGCALAFGYSYFLCVETKVFILAGTLTFSLAMYSVIEMKMQLQSQHIGDIVAL